MNADATPHLQLRVCSLQLHLAQLELVACGCQGSSPLLELRLAFLQLRQQHTGTSCVRNTKSLSKFAAAAHSGQSHGPQA